MTTHSAKKAKAPIPCKCGCGQFVEQKAGSGRLKHYVDAHKPKKSTIVLCKCGCGLPTNVGRRGRPSLYIPGHEPHVTGFVDATVLPEGAMRGLWRTHVNNCVAQNRVNELTPEQWQTLVEQACFYCGAPPATRTFGGAKASVQIHGIDRKDNSLGYTLTNVVTCCWVCNAMKKHHNVDVFLQHIFQIARHQKMIL